MARRKLISERVTALSLLDSTDLHMKEWAKETGALALRLLWERHLRGALILGLVCTANAFIIEMSQSQSHFHPMSHFKEQRNIVPPSASGYCFVRISQESDHLEVSNALNTWTDKPEA